MRFCSRGRRIDFALEPLPVIASLVDAIEARDPELLDPLARLVSAMGRGR